jgi:hypothetical protein
MMNGSRLFFANCNVKNFYGLQVASGVSMANSVGELVAVSEKL